MKKIIAGFVIGVVFAIGVLADSCVSVTASHVNVFVVFLFSGNSDFNELALHLQTKMQMTASSNQVHIIKKPPYVGIAHVLDSGKSILMQIDEGTTNRCVSIHVQKHQTMKRRPHLKLCVKQLYRLLTSTK